MRSKIDFLFATVIIEKLEPVALHKQVDNFVSIILL